MPSRIRKMTPADIPAGLALTTQAGWNQLEGDWRRALALEPEGCFAAELDGRLVGTTTCCCFGRPAEDGVAWIAMVLVEQALRGQGIGKALMERALAYLEELGVRNIWLDATALGRPLYEKLGFDTVATFLRYVRSAAPLNHPVPPSAAGAARVEAGEARDLSAILELDRLVYRYDRSSLLLRLFEEDGTRLRVCQEGGRLAGFALSRPGANAVHIGPCVGDEEAGRALVTDALARFRAQPVFVDVPESHVAARALLEGAGLQVQRPLIRMVRGQAAAVDLTRIWAGSGPEKG